MARALASQVKEFLDMWLNTKDKTNEIVFHNTITYTKFPYDHSGKFSRKYEYNVKDGFELLARTPYEIDLMGYPDVKKYTSFLVKQLIGKDCEGLSKYKQVVIHYETYTGLINLESGSENVILEIHMKKEMA